MQYFTEDFVTFFKDLGKNNHKEWFHDNKKRYETSIKKPFEPLIANKQFYFVGEEAPAIINSELLVQEIMGYWQAMYPVNNYLLKE